MGALLRYAAALALPFPWGTLSVNVVGSFLMGLAFVALAARGHEQAALFAMTGVLGGFTTFSAFSLDTLRLVEGGQFGVAAGYVVSSVLLSLLALAAAIWLARGLLP